MGEPAPSSLCIHWSPRSACTRPTLRPPPLPRLGTPPWCLKANESRGCQQRDEGRAADFMLFQHRESCSGCWHMLWRQISAVCRLKRIIWTRLWAKHLECLLKTSLTFKILWSSETQKSCPAVISPFQREGDTHMLWEHVGHFFSPPF